MCPIFKYPFLPDPVDVSPYFQFIFLKVTLLACKQKGDSHTTCNGNKGLSVSYKLQARNRMG